MSNNEYPLKFEPILQEKLWGGNKLHQFFGKVTTKFNIGESWEISNVDGYVSVVSNGFYKKQSLKEIIGLNPKDILGERVHDQYGTDFPLLIKFIDAAKDLSIQLHPNDAMAKEYHNSFGKTEMWYVIQADEEAKIIAGFQTNQNEASFNEHLKKDSLETILNIENTKEGDVYFIPPGRIHAIGAGVLLAEIQQTSDITYRVYDWNRLDTNGKPRELHTDLALKAIDYSAKKENKTPYSKKVNQPTKLVRSPYFETVLLAIDRPLERNYDDLDSFVVLMCVKGSISVCFGTNESESLQMGQTCLIPAALKNINLKPSESSKILEIFIPQ